MRRKIIRYDILDKRVAFASAGHGIPVKVNELKLAKWFEDLFNIGLCEVEMEGTDV